MKNGIPCNETYKISRAHQNTIRYTFVNDDDLTPSACSISVGDTDPITGEQITDVIFRMYRKIQNKEVRDNLDAVRVPFTDDETEERNRERAAIAAEFRKKHGYTPPRDTIEYLLEEQLGNRYNLYMDSIVDADGIGNADRVLGLGSPSVETELLGDEQSETSRLQDFAGTLSGRLLDVYRLMLEKASGGTGTMTGKALAEKWGVAPAMIVKDQKKIEKMIRAYFGK